MGDQKNRRVIEVCQRTLLRAYQGHTSETIILDVRKSQLQREGKTNKVQRRGSKELFAGRIHFILISKGKNHPTSFRPSGSQYGGQQQVHQKKTVFTHGGTRTHNLPLRRRTPYPLGHAGSVFILSLKSQGQRSIPVNAGWWFLISPLPFTCDSNRGREVKASDSKSDSLWERRFESCRLRIFF